MSKNIRITVIATLGDDHFADMQANAEGRMAALTGVRDIINSMAKEAGGDQLSALGQLDVEQFRDSLAAAMLLRFASDHVGAVQAAFVKGDLQRPLERNQPPARLTEPYSPTVIAVQVDDHDIDVRALSELPETPAGAIKRAQNQANDRAALVPAAQSAH
ncbi:hypothetical protein J5226_12760 [Lysobacter sp. K5869]|uniref:hypothetical protein n=1 Tax=Lysobacter sp. K5869 TaxID=2820808 RepID=UPI001C062A3E|nr:hypothetical protein [Lysobacter sp. K5869]QWP79196.1 hypothetical protein J5226_12760 [Lysobacter sp. K5869]